MKQAKNSQEGVCAGEQWEVKVKVAWNQIVERPKEQKVWGYEDQHLLFLFNNISW